MISYQPIAVVGIGGVFPGASNTGDFWDNIVNRVDAVSEIPGHRWVVPVEDVYSRSFAVDKTFSKRAGTVEIEFDPEGFEIEPELLAGLDPLYHCALTAAREALSKCVTSSISREKTGVVLASIALPTVGSSVLSNRIIGAGIHKKLFGEYPPGLDLSAKDIDLISAMVTSMPALLLASAFRFGGCAYTLDAACSSSLYAVKLACDELQAGRADMMLAGGVSRPEILYTQVGFTQLRALSRSGVCSPFDAKADGLVVGEGAGLMVLKRLDDAVRDNDRIYGVIRGIGLSNDMGGNLLSPESEGQVRAMRFAYELAGWSPRDVGFIECHGTGTPVGDAVELSSMRELWGDARWAEGECPIGSVKSMIGHLLTGAGAAGMIKLLLGLANRTIPPGVNFSSPPEKSPLIGSPFRVQLKPEKWFPKQPGVPLRAAVSSFGFGGINAHVLIEEWDGELHGRAPAAGVSKSGVVSWPGPPDIAVVGMETVFGNQAGLRRFQEAVLKGESFFDSPSQERWRGFGELLNDWLGHELKAGVFINEVSALIGEFNIPPREIPDILPQHLLMLTTAARALKDAGLPLRKKRPRMGVVIGMDFDVQANDYHVRWSLAKEAGKWEKVKETGLSASGFSKWVEELKNGCCPPLTSSRVVGALGGIMASRIAKQFQLGGPGFVVSCHESSGLHALEIGARSLRLNETDAFLVGAVDLPTEIRRIITDNFICRFSRSADVRPFDASADGPLPGDGAAAVVLKRLEDAVADGDRVYAVIKGIGSSTGSIPFGKSPSSRIDSMKYAYRLSLERAFAEADIEPSSISYFEAHGSADPVEDSAESDAICDFFTNSQSSSSIKQCALGTLKSNTGNVGAVAGLASFVKTSLCMYQEIVPPLVGFSSPGSGRFASSFFYMPNTPHYWFRNREEGPRRACVGSMARGGGVVHVVLEEHDHVSNAPTARIEMLQRERRLPLGLLADRAGLFVVEGENNSELIAGLDALGSYLRKIDEKNANIDMLARRWYLERGLDMNRAYAVSMVAGSVVELGKFVAEAKGLIVDDKPSSISGMRGIKYSTHLYPVGSQKGEIAFVYPGSGNHYLGMGREIGVVFPQIMRAMDRKARRLKDQFLPECYMPWRDSWEKGWEEESKKKIASDPLNMIIGQVSHGGLMTSLAQHLGIKPDVVIGYSLGESAGLFATGAWKHRSEMLDRMRASNLFKTELGGPCNAARDVWKVPPDEDVDWRVAVVNRSAGEVKKTIRHFPHVYLLIVNSFSECVIGGRGVQVREAIKALGCEAVFLEGVVTVHCDAVVPVKNAYRELHLFPVTPPEGVRFYSCAKGRPYHLTTENAAQSILDQALYGFDFTQTVRHAYKEGVRVFLEMGPHNSCTRMIQNILADKPHLAVSMCNRSENDYLSVLKCAATLIAERVPVNLDFLYGRDSCPSVVFEEEPQEQENKKITVPAGGLIKVPSLPEPVAASPAVPSPMPETAAVKPMRPSILSSGPGIEQGDKPWADVMDSIVREADATTEAHRVFLEFSEKMNHAYAQAFELQAQLLETALSLDSADIQAQIPLQNREFLPDFHKAADVIERPLADKKPSVAFTRDMCMEFAIGSIAKVLGPEFAIVDTYPVRVRLPDEPLMLVDRIVSVEGEKGSLGSGKVVTEHDVLPGAWYLQGGKAPVCIAIEAGQADLFLCSYLGIDLAVKGKRSYRLLDAVAMFHEGLPGEGDVIRYEIEIKRFVRQAETYLFFFEFKGYIDGRHVITMKNGCAGFFTPEEIKASGGVVLTKEELEPREGKVAGWRPLVSMMPEGYTDEQVDALRRGMAEECFGDLFAGIVLSKSTRLPDGRMKLIDRILSVEPEGGRYGLGSIRAEADIEPDAWFLTCHFVDDMVMPGTLMYQCCEQALRVLVLRMGWVTDRDDVWFEPVPNLGSVLKCRGPVTAETRKVVYEVELREIGYNPEPYVVADAFIYADGHRIVMFEQMSMKATGLTKEALESFWTNRTKNRDSHHRNGTASKPTLYGRDKLLAYAIGNPSEAFGKPYAVFDNERIIARLPGPPYFFMDRVTFIDHEQWAVKPGGWIEAEYTIRPDDWYFRANRQPSVPFCVLLEIALQPCGWLAAYAGSALRSEKDLKFRNLGGTAVQYVDLLNEETTLTMRARMTRVSESGGMIIQHFDIEVIRDQDSQMVYKGTTYFGFFSADALSRQVGVPKAAERAYIPSENELKRGLSIRFTPEAPLSPDDNEITTPRERGAALPSKALLMIDYVETYIPGGGSRGLGFIRGVKQVDPEEWFFKAHFYQDPVCPGSLGLESFLQLLKVVCLDRWKEFADTHCFEFVLHNEHEWIYRGQVIPENRRIEVEADIIRVEEEPFPAVFADGFLKVDGLFIYEMKNFGIRMVPVGRKKV